MLSALALPGWDHSLLQLQHLGPHINAKIVVLRASGGIGQPFSLLLNNSPLVSHLTLYNIAHIPGVATDLSHIETRVTVKGYLRPEKLANYLKGCDSWLFQLASQQNQA